MKEQTRSKQMNFFHQMKDLVDNDLVTLPPKCHEYLEGEIVDYVEGDSITMTFPLYEKYNNPIGIVLGGFIPLFFDSTMGPFAYMVAENPVSSLDLNTTFIRPVTIGDKEIKVTASLVNLSKSYLLLEGKAWNSQNKLVATATSRMKIIQMP